MLGGRRPFDGSPEAARRTRIGRVFWEGFGVLTAVIAGVTALAGLGLVCFAAYKIKARSFRVRVSVFNILTVSFEVESSPDVPAQRAPVRAKSSRIR
jgi:hypothetical protein